MKTNLTIILLLKERKEYTLRFIEFFLENNFNYNLFIADGSKKKIESFILKKIKKYPNIIYKKFPEDKNYNLFFKKRITSLKMIKTKYVLFASNDDFLIYGTINKCLKILQNNKNLNGAGGSIYSFSLSKNKKFITNIRPLYFNLNFNQKDLKERVNFYFQNTSSTMHYLMNRKNLIKSLVTSFKNFSNNIEINDLSSDLNNIINGKIKIIKSPILFHQSTPSSEASKRPGIILKNLKDEKFYSDVLKLIDIIYKKTKINKQKLFIKYYNTEIIPFMKNLSFKSEISLREMVSALNVKIKRRIMPKTSSNKKLRYNNNQIKNIEKLINNFLNSFN